MPKLVARLDGGVRFPVVLLARHFCKCSICHLLTAANLAAARAALDAPVPDTVVVELVEAFMRRVVGIE